MSLRLSPLWTQIQTALQEKVKTPVDFFHIGGRKATTRWLNLISNSPHSILDLGCGLGGTSRLLNVSFPEAKVIGIDLNGEFCQIAHCLNVYTAQPEHPYFVQANALNLPFPPHAFDLIISEHVQMSIQDKAKWIQSIYKTLKPQGQVILYEIFMSSDATPHSPLYTPLPWATNPANSYLHTLEYCLTLCQSSGFYIQETHDMTKICLDWLTQKLQKSNATGTDLVMGDKAMLKQFNLQQHLKESSLSVAIVNLKK